MVCNFWLILLFFISSISYGSDNIDVKDILDEEFLHHFSDVKFYELIEFINGIDKCSLEDIDDKIEYILNINSQRICIFSNLTNKIFPLKENKNIKQNKSYQLVQRRKKENNFEYITKENSVEWVTSEKCIPIKNWIISNLSEIMTNDEIFYPLPTGRNLLKFWSLISVMEYLNTKCIESFFLDKIKQDKNYFPKEKRLFEIINSRSAQIEEAIEIRKRDFNKSLSLREDIFNILKEKYFNIYYNNIDHGLLALIEFLKIDFDANAIYDFKLKNKRSLSNNLLLCTAQNHLYELFIGGMQQSIQPTNRIVSIKDSVSKHIGEGDLSYSLVYDPNQYDDCDNILEYNKKREEKLQNLMNDDEKSKKNKPIKKITKRKNKNRKKTHRTAPKDVLKCKLDPQPRAKHTPTIANYRPPIMLKDLDNEEIRPSTIKNATFTKNNNFFKAKLLSLKETFINQIEQEPFDNKKNYSAMLDTYSNQCINLLKNIIYKFEEFNPLKNGKNIEQSMAFLAVGSLAQGLSVPSSDLEIIVLIDEWQAEYFIWLSKLFNELKKIGFKLDHENLHPPIFATKKEKLQEGNFFTIGTPHLFASYYELSNIDERSLTKLINDMPVEIKTWYEKDIKPGVEKVDNNNLPYWHDPSAQMIDNIRKNLVGNKYIYGNKDLISSFNELMQDKQEIYMQILDNVSIKYNKFYYKNHLDSANEKEDIKYYAKYYEQDPLSYSKYATLYDFVAHKMKNIFYRPLQLLMANYYLLEIAHSDLSKTKSTKLIKELRRYVSFLRRRIEKLESSKQEEQLNDVDTILEKLGFEQSYFDEHIRPLYNFINDLLLQRKLSYKPNTSI